MYNRVIGYEISDLKSLTVEQIAELIRKVQAGLAPTEPKLTEEEIQVEAQAIYIEANSDF